jgi:hypothetical protein
MVDAQLVRALDGSTRHTADQDGPSSPFVGDDLVTVIAWLLEKMTGRRQVWFWGCCDGGDSRADGGRNGDWVGSGAAECFR